jgi:hypothetical protein
MRNTTTLPFVQKLSPGLVLYGCISLRRRRRQPLLGHQSCICLTGQLEIMLLPHLDASSCVTRRRDHRLPRKDSKEMHNRMRVSESQADASAWYDR